MKEVNLPRLWTMIPTLVTSEKEKKHYRDSEQSSELPGISREGGMGRNRIEEF